MPELNITYKTAHGTAPEAKTVALSETGYTKYNGLELPTLDRDCYILYGIPSENDYSLTSMSVTGNGAAYSCGSDNGSFAVVLPIDGVSITKSGTTVSVALNAGYTLPPVVFWANREDVTEQILGFSSAGQDVTVLDGINIILSLAGTGGYTNHIHMISFAAGS